MLKCSQNFKFEVIYCVVICFVHLEQFVKTFPAVFRSYSTDVPCDQGRADIFRPEANSQCLTPTVLTPQAHIMH